MIRARFHANEDDYRPVKFPPPGPYWCSGSGDSFSVIVAYLRNEDEIYEYWPEANNIDIQERDEILFTDRFPCPEWWPNDKFTI